MPFTTANGVRTYYEVSGNGPPLLLIAGNGMDHTAFRDQVPSFAREDKSYPIRGTLAKLLYVSLFQMHRVALHGWLRAGALFVADRLRGTTLPPVKLH